MGWLWIGTKIKNLKQPIGRKKRAKIKYRCLDICAIPITTRSGIEVEHISPVAMYLSQTINLVHSIFFWVDIHCYVGQKVCISSDLNITCVINF